MNCLLPFVPPSAFTLHTPTKNLSSRVLSDARFTFRFPRKSTLYTPSLLPCPPPLACTLGFCIYCKVGAGFQEGYKACPGSSRILRFPSEWLPCSCPVQCWKSGHRGAELITRKAFSRCTISDVTDICLLGQAVDYGRLVHCLQSPSALVPSKFKFQCWSQQPLPAKDQVK